MSAAAAGSGIAIADSALNMPLIGQGMLMIPFKIGLLSAQLGSVRQMRTSLQLPNPTRVSGGKKAAPLGESGGA
jgi:hypothetical protein